MAPQGQTPRSELRVGQARERALSELALRQHGVVTLASAARARIRADWRSRGGSADGRLQARAPRGLRGRHSHLSMRGRWLAAVLACGEGALLSHRSAAALWGLAKPASRVVDVTAPRWAPGHSPQGDASAIHRGRLHPEDRALRAGIPVTIVARTLVDLAEFVSLEAARDEPGRRRIVSTFCELRRRRGRHASAATDAAP